MRSRCCFRIATVASFEQVDLHRELPGFALQCCDLGFVFRDRCGSRFFSIQFARSYWLSHNWLKLGKCFALRALQSCRSEYLCTGSLELWTVPMIRACHEFCVSRS